MYSKPLLLIYCCSAFVLQENHHTLQWLMTSGDSKTRPTAFLDKADSETLRKWMHGGIIQPHSDSDFSTAKHKAGNYTISKLLRDQKSMRW